MDLERELSALQVEWPATPGFALQLGRRRRRWPLAVAIALAAIAIAFAVPQSRASILHFFAIGRVHVRVVDTLPPAQQRPLSAGLGKRVSLEEARADVPGILLPATAAVPALYLAHGNVLSLVFVHEGEPLLLSELVGGGGVYLKKLAAGSTGIVGVRVGDAPGLWLSGSPHVFFTPQRSPRLAGNVLLWESDSTTYRLEGRKLGKSEAIAIAESLRRG
ncbi:MAG TPA: hypothetical protein VGH82_01195 [Gaiellaceae bacterium]|jgi:hypothetical protein